MHWPWIKRAKYDELLARVEQIERERQPVPISIKAENPPAEKPEKERPLATRATFDQIETAANAAAANGDISNWLTNRRKAHA